MTRAPPVTYVDGGVTMATAVHCLLCQVGSSYLGLPLEHVLEVMRPLPLERVGVPSEAPDWLLGVSVIRGSATPVIDARRVMLPGSGEAAEAAPANGAAPGRLVSLRIAQRTVALAVDAVLGAHRLSPQITSTGVAPLLASSSLLCALGTLDGKLLAVLNAAWLLSAASLHETGWHAIER